MNTGFLISLFFALSFSLHLLFIPPSQLCWELPRSNFQVRIRSSSSSLSAFAIHFTIYILVFFCASRSFSLLQWTILDTPLCVSSFHNKLFQRLALLFASFAFHFVHFSTLFASFFFAGEVKKRLSSLAVFNWLSIESSMDKKKLFSNTHRKQSWAESAASFPCSLLVTTSGAKKEERHKTIRSTAWGGFSGAALFFCFVL